MRHDEALRLLPMARLIFTYASPSTPRLLTTPCQRTSDVIAYAA